MDWHRGHTPGARRTDRPPRSSNPSTAIGAARLRRLPGRSLLIGAFALLALLSAPGAARADLDLPTGFSAVTGRRAARGPDRARLRARRADVHRREGRPRARGRRAAGRSRARRVIDISDHVDDGWRPRAARHRGRRRLRGQPLRLPPLHLRRRPRPPGGREDLAADAHHGAPDNTVANALTARRRSCSGATGHAPCPAPANDERLHPVDERLAFDRHRARRSRRHALGRIGRRRAVQLHGPDGAADVRRAVAGRQDPPHRPRGPRPAGHRSAPRRPTSPWSARSSTRRASATRSASSCAPARPRSSATSAGTPARSSTSSSRAAATAGPATRAPPAPPHYEELAACRAQYASDPPSQTPPAYALRRRSASEERSWPARGTRRPATPRSSGAHGSSATTPGLDQGLRPRRRQARQRAHVRARRLQRRRRPRDHAGGRPRLRGLRRREREQRQPCAGSSSATHRRPPWPTRRPPRGRRRSRWS